MVLESLVSPFNAAKHPKEMFFIGFIYNTIAIILSLWVFRPHASLVMVFLTALAAVPLVYATIKQEETKDTLISKETVLLKEHGRILAFLMWFFLGITISVALWYVLLPFVFSIFMNEAQVALIHSQLFDIQITTIEAINQGVSLTGSAVHPFSALGSILINNLWVLGFCIIFSFFYGAGALFILVWNASTIGVAIGSFITQNLGTLSGAAVPLALVRYLTHGVFEVGGYFAAGLAGGIISIAVINHDINTKKFGKILMDSLDLLLLALILLVIGALVEVFVTPLII